MDSLRIGIPGIPISFNGKYKDCFDRIRDLDLDVDECQFNRQVWADKKMALEIKKNAEKNDIALTIHGSYFINLCSADEKIRQASIKRLRDAAEIGEIMGATRIAFHPGFFGKLEHEEVFQIIKKNIKEAIKGFKDIKLAPENMAGPTKFGRIDEMLRLCKEVKNVVPTIDFAHYFADTKGEQDYTNVLKKVKNELGGDALKELHMHISGMEYNENGAEKRHIPFSVAKNDYRKVMNSLKELGVKGTIICESPLIEADASLMKKYYNKL